METAIWQSYQNYGVLLLGIINTSNQNQIDNFVSENSITFPIFFDSGSPGGVQGGNTYDDYYMPNDGSPYPRDFIIDQEGIVAYANNEIDTEWMLYVINDLFSVLNLFLSISKTITVAFSFNNLSIFFSESILIIFSK